MKVDQIKAGIILNYSTVVLNMIVGICYTPYLLRCLGQNEYGLYSLVASIVAYLSVLDFGFGNATIRYTAKLRAQSKVDELCEMLGMFMRLYLIIGILALIAGLGIVFNVNNIFDSSLSPEELEKARIMMLMLVINVALTFPLSIYGSILQAYEIFVVPKFLDLLRILLTTVVMIALLSLGYKALALVTVQVVVNIAILIANLLYCKKIVNIKVKYGKIDRTLLKEITVYSFWIFWMLIIDNLYWNTGQFVLGSAVGTAAVAIFAVAVQLHDMHQRFSTAMSAIFLPKITAMVATTGNEKSISDFFIKCGRIQYIVLSFVLVAFVLFGREFINLWAGTDYDQAYIMTLLLFVPTTIPLIQNIGIIILQARNQMKFRAICYTFTAILNLILQIILVKQYEGIGCSFSIAIAVCVGHILVMNVYYHKKQHLDMICFWRNISKMTLFPFMMMCLGGCVIKVLNFEYSWTAFIATTSIFTLVYAPFSYLFQMNEYEKYLFKSILIKIKQW